MDEQMISAGSGEVVEVVLGLDDHQMHVDRLRCRFAYRFDDNWPDRDVRHKAPIHHIDMDPISPRRVDGSDLIGEPAEIGRQDRRGNDDRTAHKPGSALS